eukprot:GHVU01105963.1.p1 GENE.GHVU01105963.1~~GHVU01105963.1.p1  ORF type:complete len:111 (-),score=2.64 GHVU01105963.1:196-528(-)
MYARIHARTRHHQAPQAADATRRQAGIQAGTWQGRGGTRTDKSNLSFAQHRRYSLHRCRTKETGRVPAFLPSILATYILSSKAIYYPPVARAARKHYYVGLSIYGGCSVV